MSCGISWAHAEIEKEENTKIAEKFKSLTPGQCRRIVDGLHRLGAEALTRGGHNIIDFILEALGEK